MSGWKAKLGGLAAPLREYAEKACTERMSANIAIKDIKLKGTTPHLSHDGTGKKEKVISIQMLNEKSARVETIHVDENGDVDVKALTK